MRAFSLIELMIASSLSLIVLLGTLQFAGIMAKDGLRQRHRVTAHANLEMAAARLRSDVAELEPEFWSKFPPRADLKLVHATEFGTGAVGLSNACPSHPKTACALFRNLFCPKGALVYKLNGSDWPYFLALGPLQDSDPQPEMPEPATVLLAINGEEVTPLLTRFSSGFTCYLAKASESPWLIPETGPALGSMVISLGQLQVEHLYLKPDKELGAQLLHEPWRMVEGQWEAARSFSSYGQLLEMRPVHGSNGQNQLLLVAAHPASEPIPALILHDKAYTKEVACAAISF